VILADKFKQINCRELFFPLYLTKQFYFLERIDILHGKQFVNSLVLFAMVIGEHFTRFE